MKEGVELRYQGVASGDSRGAGRTAGRSSSDRTGEDSQLSGPQPEASLGALAVLPSRPVALIATYENGLNVPPIVNAARSLEKAGYLVNILQLPPNADELRYTVQHEGLGVSYSPQPLLPRGLGPLWRLERWLRFTAFLRQKLVEMQPDVLVTIMLHPLAVVPPTELQRRQLLVSCLYAIRDPRDAGRLDRLIFRKAWAKLKEADVVWVSDRFMARLAQDFGELPALPMVCAVGVPLDFLPEPTWPRDGWLRSEVRRAGALIGDTGGCILLRAGAVGRQCGIEETLEAMEALPDDFVFVMLGRPDREYASFLAKEIERRGLLRRAFLWTRMPDDTWKRALRGADIGHMIHGPFEPGREKRTHDLNSCLSVCRLYYYFAAGLPIVSYDDPRMEALYAEVPCFRVARLSALSEDLKRILNELAADSALRGALGRAARAAHVECYNWERQFRPVMDAVLKGRSVQQ